MDECKTEPLQPDSPVGRSACPVGIGQLHEPAELQQSAARGYGDAALDLLAATFGVREEPPRHLSEAERAEYREYTAFMQA